MANTLDTVTLPSQIVWVNQFQQQHITQSGIRTLGGGLILSELSLVSGRSIVLRGLIDQGWFTKTQVEAIITLSQVQGTSIILVLGSDTFSVTFDHSRGPAVAFIPLVFRLNSAAGDFFTGTINLITLD